MFKIFCTLIFTLLINSAFSQSVEQGNAFNKFMGAEGGVNPLSGSVAFKKSLATISSGNATYDIEMSYSGNVQEIVKNKNDIAQIGWVGLGWSLGHAKIVADDAGTMWIGDDSYYLQTGTGLRYKIVKDDNGKWWIENLPYWQIEQKTELVTFKTTDGGKKYSIVVGWVVISDAGIKYTYGDNDFHDGENNPKRIATEYTIANPYTFGIVGVYENGDAALYPSAWNLSKIEDYDGNYLTFSYEQYEEKVRKNIRGTSKAYITKVGYTKECYLKSIESSKGERIVFTTEYKDFEREFIDNKGESEVSESSDPDTYMDPMERRFLSQIVIYGRDNLPLKYIDFCYEPLNVKIKGEYNQDYVKRLLVSISETGRNKEEIQKESFNYIRDEVDESGKPLPLGSIESVAGPNCGTVKYEYKELPLLEVDPFTGLHKENVPLSDFSLGQMEDGTIYIVGQGKIYIKTPKGWVFQQAIDYSSQLAIIGDKNWFILKKELNVSGDKVSYTPYVWDGMLWKKMGTFTDDRDKNFVAIGPGYLLTAHVNVSEKKLEWSIPWSMWGKTESNTSSYSNTIGSVDSDPTDRASIRLLAGKNHFAIYYKKAWNWGANGALNIYSFVSDSEKETFETGTPVDLDIIDIRFLDENTFIGIIEDGDNAFAYHWHEDGNRNWGWDWINIDELEGWHGRESIQATGDDYFVTRHNDKDCMSLFIYDGKKWNVRYNNEDMVHDQDYDPVTEAEWEAVPGYNFFVARKPRILEHWYGNEIKPFREYERIERKNGEWTRGTTESSGDEKIVYAGSDWYFIKNNQIGYIRNGFDWKLEDYSGPYSKFMQGNDIVFRDTKRLSSKNGDFFVERLIDGSDIYYKKNDSFKGTVKGFFVSRKHVMDPVEDKVVTYEYDYVSNSLGTPPTYDYTNKTPVVRAYVVKLPDNAGIVEKKLCDDEDDELGTAFGEICEENYYNSSSAQKPTKSIKRDYERYRNASWPHHIYMDRIVSTTSTINNLTKTEKYIYADDVNGMVAKTLLYDNNQDKNLSETVNVYAAEKYSNLRNQNCNRLMEKTATYQCVPDCISGEIVSGEVAMYPQIGCDAHVNEQWIYTPPRKGREKSFTFDWNSSTQGNAWTSTKRVASFYNGIPNESVNQLGVKSAVILEKGAVNWPVANVENAGLDEVLILPGDECNIENWKEECTTVPMTGRYLGKNYAASASAYGRFSKTAILVDKQNSLKGVLKKAKSPKYRFSAWAQGTSHGVGSDKINLKINSSLKNEFSLTGDGVWEYIEWPIEFSTGEEDNVLLLSAVNESKIHLQDVRLVPEDALVQVTFYDKVLGQPIAKVDDRSVGSYIEYDALGRVIGVYGETVDGTIVQKSKTSYTQSVCAESSDKNFALKELVVNGEHLAISTTPGTIEIAVKNSTDELNISWKTFVEGENVFYSLHESGESASFEKSRCGGSCEITQEFQGSSMTLDIAVSSYGKPYKVKISKSTSGWIDYGKPLTKGFNPGYLSDKNVYGVRYLTEDKIKKAVFNGSEWTGYLPKKEDNNQEEKREVYVSLGGAINNGIDYVFALPNFVGTGGQDPYYAYTSDRNALGFKDVSSNGSEPSWDNMGSFDKTGVKSEKYHMVTSPDNKTYVLYEKTEFTEVPNPANSRIRKFSDQKSLVVKRLNGNSWTNMGTVAYSAIMRNEETIEKTCFPFVDADIAIGKNNVPFVAYIGNVLDYTVSKKFVKYPQDNETNVNPDDLDDYVSYPAVLIVKHYNVSSNKWVGFSSETGDVLKITNGSPLPNAKSVKLASDGTNLYMAVLYNDALSSQYALKVYKLIETSSEIQFVELVDQSFGSAIIAYLEENNHLDLAVYQDTPYVSFVNSANKNNITVVKYSAGLWRSVGLPAFANVGSKRNDADLAIGTNGLPYVVLREGVNSQNTNRIGKIVPMRYNADGDKNLTIASISEIPGTSLSKDFRQYILNYDASVPMTETSISFDITFAKKSDVRGVYVENNGTYVYSWKKSHDDHFIMFDDNIHAEMPKFDVDLNVGPNEIKLHIYGSKKLSELIYTFNISRDFVYTLDFNSKKMGDEIGVLVSKGTNYSETSSSSVYVESSDGSYNPGIEFNASSSSRGTSFTSVENFEYKIYPPDDGSTSKQMCLEYNSAWYMIIDGHWFSKPECLEYDFERNEFIISSGSSSIINSSSSARGNQITFIDDRGNKKIVDVIVISSSSYLYEFSSSSIQSSSDVHGSSEYSSSSCSSSILSSSGTSSSSQNGYIDDSVIPNEYSSLYNYKFVAETNVSFENNVSIANGDYIAGNVNVAAGAQIQGNVFCSGNMTLSSNAYVNSIVLGGNINSQAGATYGSMEQGPVSVPYISRKTFNVGNAPLNVWAGQSVTLSPGEYGDVSVYSNANVVFEPGIYYFKSLYIAPDVKVKTENTNGLIQIWVQNNMRIDDRASFMNGHDPKKVLLYGNGFFDMYIGVSSKVFATIIYPNGNVNVAPRMEFLGAIWAKSIIVGANTTVR